MQPSTCSRLRVRYPTDAHAIFHAVYLGFLPMVTRRLDTDERRAISSGSVYVWEERGPTAEATGLGIERWTDSISWGPSRVRDEFLFYNERKHPVQAELDTTSDSDTTTHARREYFRPTLIKQTYSVFVATPYGRRKWHLIAYFTQETLDQLHTIDDHPHHPRLANLQVPTGMYTCARSSKTRISGAIRTRHPYHPANEPVHAVNLNAPQLLAPLAYLKTLPPPRRHVLDEMALMALSAMMV